MAKKETAIKVKRGIMKDLTLEEVSKMAHQMADTMTEIKKLEDEAKGVASDYKDQIAGKKAELNALKDQIEAGQYSAQVECDRVKNFDKGVIEFWYEGNVIETQTMSAEDHQADLNFAETANAEEAKRIESEKSTSDSVKDQVIEEQVTEEVKLTKDQKQRFRELTDAANVATKERRFDDAVALYDDALEIKPTDAKALEKRKQLIPFTTKEK